MIIFAFSCALFSIAKSPTFQQWTVPMKIQFLREIPSPRLDVPTIFSLIPSEKGLKKNSMICQFRHHLRYFRNPIPVNFQKNRPSQHRYICLPLGASNVAVRCVTRPVVLSTPGPSLQVLIFLVGAKVQIQILISVGFGMDFFMDLFLSFKRFRKMVKSKATKMLGLDDVFNDFGFFF